MRLLQRPGSRYENHNGQVFFTQSRATAENSIPFLPKILCVIWPKLGWTAAGYLFCAQAAAHGNMTDALCLQPNRHKEPPVRTVEQNLSYRCCHSKDRFGFFYSLFYIPSVGEIIRAWLAKLRLPAL